MGSGGGGGDTSSFGQNWADSTSSNSSWSSGNSTSGSTQGVWDPQAAALTEMYGELRSQYGAARDGIDNYTDEANKNLGWVVDRAGESYENQAAGGNTVGSLQDSGGFATGSLQADGGFATGSLQASGGFASGSQQAAGGLLAGNGTAANQYNSTMSNALDGPSNARTAYDSNIGPGGSLANMQSMYQRQASTAANDMMNNMDARASASGMSGGSRHGTGIAQGMNDINTNYMNNMANTSYDAYNRDLDRNLGIAGDDDNRLMDRQQLMSQDIAGMNNAQQFAIGQQDQAQQFAIGSQDQAQQFAIGSQDRAQQFSLGAQDAAQQSAMANMNNAGDLVMQGYQPSQMAMQNLGMGADILGAPFALTNSYSDSNQSSGSAGQQNSTAYGYTDSNGQTDPRYAVNGTLGGLAPAESSGSRWSNDNDF